MAVQRFRKLLQLIVHPKSIRRATGPVEDVDKLLQRPTLERLDLSFNGAYALIVHHPRVDRAIQAYVDGPTMADDAGRSVFVLYEAAPAATPAAAPADSGIGALAETRALVDFVRAL